jgi:hypothetical protein
MLCHERRDDGTMSMHLIAHQQRAFALALLLLIVLAFAELPVLLS